MRSLCRACSNLRAPEPGSRLTTSCRVAARSATVLTWREAWRPRAFFPDANVMRQPHGGMIRRTKGTVVLCSVRVIEMCAAAWISPRARLSRLRTVGHEPVDPQARMPAPALRAHTPGRRASGDDRPCAPACQRPPKSVLAVWCARLQTASASPGRAQSARLIAAQRMRDPAVPDPASRRREGAATAPRLRV